MHGEEGWFFMKSFTSEKVKQKMLHFAQSEAESEALSRK
jgi:hypothetical protein